MKLHATTIIGMLYKGQAAMAGDGQVTFDEQIMKTKAIKIRKMYNGKILAGFAGTAADAFALYELFEKKIEEFNGNLQRASVELAKEWRTDKTLQKLEALIVVANTERILLISGNGDVVEPDDGIVAVGSGGGYALAAARALIFATPKMPADKIVHKALELASEICVYTNNNISVETIK